jgi:trans-aconitate methyltransferase
MSQWSAFYKDRMNTSYENYLRERYAPFINEIVKRPYKIIAEYGCGPGFITKIIQNDYPRQNVTYYLHDNDADILRLAQHNLYDKSNVGNIFIKYNDITKTPMLLPRKVDIIHSHGVLEHFDNESIANIIALQRNNAKTLIHYVPSNKYTTPSFGDERLMSPSEWQDICNPTKIVEFNDGFDLVLIWEKI